MFPVHSRIEIIFSKWTSDKMCDAHSELLEKCYFLCTKIFVFIIHANIFRNSSLLNSKTGLCYKQMCECFFSGKQRLTIIILSQYSFPIIITEMRLIEYNEPSLYTINSEWSQKKNGTDNFNVWLKNTRKVFTAHHFSWRWFRIHQKKNSIHRQNAIHEYTTIAW